MVEVEVGEMHALWMWLRLFDVDGRGILTTSSERATPHSYTCTICQFNTATLRKKAEALVKSKHITLQDYKTELLEIYNE